MQHGIAESSGERSPTKRGVLWIGLRCDMRCKFCYDAGVDTKEKIWITPADAEAALRKYRHFYGNEAVDFMGGEPTLHPHILDIVNCAARTGLRPTISTHGMHLASREVVEKYAAAGIHDFLVSIHGIGELAAEIHGRQKDNFERQTRALDNLRVLGIPFRINCTLIKDNLTHLTAIVDLAAEKGARVVNFLTFNPYFEWKDQIEIGFQARHGEIVPHLREAIARCATLGMEANVRYMPICQLRGLEAHAYTGFQLPYDPHEWDFNSWYDMGHEGVPSPEWYYQASLTQQRRYGYMRVDACAACSAAAICDGFHPQYVARFGGAEAQPLDGPLITDPQHFIRHQVKVAATGIAAALPEQGRSGEFRPLALSQFQAAEQHRAGVRPASANTAGDR